MRLAHKREERLVRGSPQRVRLTWSLVDQGLSSLTNFLALFVLANMLSVTAFGAVSLAAITSVVFVGIPRAMVHELLLIEAGSAGSIQGKMLGAACIVSVPGTFLLFAVGAFLDGAARSAFLALGVWLAGLLVLDALRYSAFASDRHDLAARADFFWLVSTSGGLLYAHAQGIDSLFVLVSLWVGDRKSVV